MQDHLGSIAAIADETGAVIERLAYDPWGKRRNVNGLADKADSLVGVNTDRGYTLHEHLDEVGVIHMNGRVYDPLIGRFMSADPFIQAPGNLQSYNRYAYVMYNSLFYTDPSGYLSLKKVFKTVVVIAVAYYTGGAVAGSLGVGAELMQCALQCATVGDDELPQQRLERANQTLDPAVLPGCLLLGSGVWSLVVRTEGKRRI